jgi:hypothetical protein
VDKDRPQTFNEKNIAEFRASNGRIASFGDAPLIAAHHHRRPLGSATDHPDDVSG